MARLAKEKEQEKERQDKAKLLNENKADQGDKAPTIKKQPKVKERFDYFRRANQLVSHSIQRRWHDVSK
ncbi:MAG: hypothetical protein MZU97_24405 [Bacillus subtilis]|nr:hypothetical protein [Bacillus subtilis]